MYHSITFGEKNTWDDWNLVPTERPLVNPPSPKTKIVEIPGANLSIDLSRATSRYPLFNNREGSFSFYIMNDYHDWHDLYEEMKNYLHGKVMTMILEDDPSFFYKGRFALASWSQNGTNSVITINYNLEPYKWRLNNSIDDWYWDAFDFDNDVITQDDFKDIQLADPDTWVTVPCSPEAVGYAPVMPIFVIDANSPVTVRVQSPSIAVNHTEVFEAGEHSNPKFIFYGGDANISLKGVGSVSVVFRGGKL